MREKLIALTRKRTDKGISLLHIAKESGVAYAPLWRMIHDGTGHMRNWEKLEAYYRRPKP